MIELAYIDAGSGSLIIQGAIASVAAVVFFFRSQIARLIPGRRKGAEPADTTRTSHDDAAQGS